MTKHECDPPSETYAYAHGMWGGPGFGALWRCLTCGRLWVYTTDNVAWCGWNRAGLVAKIRAKLGWKVLE